MERLAFEDIEPWLLSGQPVIRLWGKDYDQSTDHYMDWIRSMSETLNLKIALRRIADPPGVIVCAHLGDEAPVLVDPLVKVNKKTCGWLYCIQAGCRNRLAPGLPPGGTCQNHQH